MEGGGFRKQFSRMKTPSFMDIKTAKKEDLPLVFSGE
jgi:hypothetical protein